MLKDTVSAGEMKLKNPADVLRLPDLQKYSRGTRWKSWRHVMAPGHLLARSDDLATNIEDLSKYDPRECVCFVFGGGEETNDRETTRIGGLPFWPADLAWPLTQDGVPKQFIGQFDFRNIAWPEPLPGDVLTVHFDYECDGDGRFCGPADGAAATLVWHDSQKVKNLIDRDKLPPPNEWYEEPGPFYGLPVLVTDYKSKWSEHAHALTIHGMKIGGHSPLFRTNWQESLSALTSPVFLCSIGYVLPDPDKEEKDAWLPSKPGFDPGQAGEVMFDDVGVLVIAYEKGDPSNLHWLTYMP